MGDIAFVTYGWHCLTVSLAAVDTIVSVTSVVLASI